MCRTSSLHSVCAQSVLHCIYTIVYVPSLYCTVYLCHCRGNCRHTCIILHHQREHIIYLHIHVVHVIPGIYTGNFSRWDMMIDGWGSDFPHIHIIQYITKWLKSRGYPQVPLGPLYKTLRVQYIAVRKYLSIDTLHLLYCMYYMYIDSVHCSS